ncbi:MAG: SMC-Scp complex subunit ScpB [Bacteroidota bacterium]
MEPLERVTEALVFAADEPVTARAVAEVYVSVTGNEDVDEATIEEAVDALNLAYQQAGRAVRIERWAGGFRMATIREVAPFVQAFVAEEAERRLTRSLMETLAVIAYKQPVTKPEVDFVRGVDSDYALKKLLDKAFVEIVGRAEAVGRPLLYGTTGFFLEQFGLSALDELPRPREIEQLLNDPAFVQERTELLINIEAGAEGETRPEQEASSDGEAAAQQAEG